MRLCQFLMQDESFPISHAGWDFLVFSLKMRFSHILIQDETFPISHAGWDFSVFLCYMRLFVRGMKKKNTLLRPLHYVLAVKNIFSKKIFFLFFFFFFFEKVQKNNRTRYIALCDYLKSEFEITVKDVIPEENKPFSKMFNAKIFVSDNLFL